jgi:hypothetical protein
MSSGSRRALFGVTPSGVKKLKLSTSPSTTA